MKRTLNICIVIVLIFLHKPSHPTILAKGNVPDLTSTFSVPITTKIYDRVAGTIYFGLAGGAEFALAKGLRYSGFSTPIFAGIATNTLLSGKTIEFLALAGSKGSTNANIGVVTKNGATSFTQTQLIASNSTGKVVIQSAALLDASGAVGNDGLVTSGIVGLAANQTCMFAPVRPNGGGNFGDANGGVALVSIASGSLALTQLAAQPGDSGIKAAALALTSPQIQIGAAPPTMTTPNFVTLFWDNDLQRLYTGLQLTTTAGSGARSVVPAYVDTNNKLIFQTLAPNAAFVAGDFTRIIGVNDVAAQNLSALKLRVMHCSTGPSYLIVNGGNGLAAATTSQVYAIPLVDVGNPQNPTQGVEANKNIFNAATHRFETPAAVQADLTASTDIFALVGDSRLPLGVDEFIADMVVVGDAVYVSTQVAAADPTNPRNGIFYSEALFDQTGQIVRWTPWTKRAAPFDPNLDDSKLFFDVDAVNGRLWLTNGNENVYSTTWDYGATTTSLTRVLATAMQNGSYSVLDLDQSTRGLGISAPGRYALFGGLGTVAFARTSVSTNLVAPFDTDGAAHIVAQSVPTNFTLPQNFLLTLLPGSAGAVQVLEYSRRLAAGGNTNYFFAGTQNGLYVFSTGGNGFTVNATVNALNAAPFLGSWQRISTITGAVVDIKTTGQTLYVMTLESSETEPIKSKIFRIDFQTTVAAMFAPGNIFLIAESEINSPPSDLTQAKIFQGMQPIVTNATIGAEIEQLVVATNHGMYASTNVLGVQVAANQAAAAWAPVDATDSTMYYGVAAADQGLDLLTPTEPIAPTTWPISILDQYGLKTFARGGIRQLNGVALPFAYVPTQFNANALTNSTFASFDPILYFWSEGGRRFLIIEPQPSACGISTCAHNNLLLSPFDVVEWGVTGPQVGIVSSAALSTVGLYFWARHLGDTGIFMAGTNTGVVALE